MVAQQRPSILFSHSCPTLREASDAALAFAGESFSRWEDRAAQCDLALEPCGYRPNLHLGDRTKSLVVGLLELLAVWNAGLEHGWSFS